MASKESFTDRNIGRRTASRTSCDLMVEFKDSAGNWSLGRLANMSGKGFKLEGVRTRPANSSLWLRPKGMKPLAARVCWSASGSIGCEFLYPLDQSTEDELRGLAARDQPALPLLKTVCG